VTPPRCRVDKIGILTFHRSLNVGAVLQAWALHIYLRSKGFDARIIDYGHIGCSPRLKIKQFCLRSIVRLFYHFIMSFPMEDFRRAKYSKFINDHFFMTRNVCRTDLPFLSMDCYICGSDLIWHPDRNEEDMSYFLDFVSSEARKVAYAPSFGDGHFSAAQERMIKESINRFDLLSVRETFSCKVLRNFANIDAPIVCDPTILLSVSYYVNVERRVKKLPSQYILLYVICGHPFAEAFSEKLSDETGLKVIYYFSGEGMSRCSKHQKGRLMNVGPAEFLYLVHNSSAVVTNSYHGLVFSLLYHKTPYVMLNDSKLDVRMTDLTSYVGLSGNVVSASDTRRRDTNINWQNVDNRLRDLRQTGVSFLEQLKKL